MNLIDYRIDIQTNLLSWFSENGRHWIPWKCKKDGSLPEFVESILPYGIWIADVMLQQTQLKVVIPYWGKWMKTFPTSQDLSEAEEQNVLLKWQGLGYYSRAKRIYKASKLLIELIGKDKILNPSTWPVELEECIALTGVGRSTAASLFLLLLILQRQFWMEM